MIRFYRGDVGDYTAIPKFVFRIQDGYLLLEVRGWKDRAKADPLPRRDWRQYRVYGVYAEMPEWPRLTGTQGEVRTRIQTKDARVFAAEFDRVARASEGAAVPGRAAVTVTRAADGHAIISRS